MNKSVMTPQLAWVKQGPIFTPDTSLAWSKTHAQIPCVDLCEDGTLRIFYATRDAQNHTATGRVDLDADDPRRILRTYDRPVLSLGKMGAFDDSGAMPSCVVRHDGTLYLYYIGWNVGVTVRYRNSIGLAIWDDSLQSFVRFSDGPVMDRTHDDPYLMVTPHVLIEDGVWRMWYCSCTGWRTVDGLAEPQYLIRYAESRNGVDWQRAEAPCIPYRYDGEAITRPWVVRETWGYRMWYCYRDSRGYRTDRRQSYRIGYAESPDGVQWTRHDEAAALDVSESGWDSQMVAYPCVYRHRGKMYMLYNGNGFGRDAFGLAVVEVEGEE